MDNIINYVKFSEEKDRSNPLYFFKVPNILVDEPNNLSDAEFRLYLILMKYSSKNGFAYPSYKTLSKFMGVSKRQTINIMNSLVKKNFVRKVKRINENGDFTSNHYYLNDLEEVLNQNN